MSDRAAAYEDWKAGMKPTAIAKKYGVPVNTVKSWLARSKKDEGAKKDAPAKPKRVHPSKPGAPAGNQNAAGNIGGGAPSGNKNNYRHGFYYDTLTPEEQAFVDTHTPITEAERLLNELDLWEIKERRLLREMEKLRAIPTGGIVQSITKSKKASSTTVVNVKEYLLRYDTLLTQAQRAHARCIKDLHQIKLDLEKLELLKKRLGDSDEEALEKLDAVLKKMEGV